VVLADPDHIQPDLVCQDAFLDHVAEHGIIRQGAALRA
jgi:hypothetical protein